MTRPRLALVLWAVLAVVVFNVAFDWYSRTAGLAFIEEQTFRHSQGRPIATIEEGFRPLVGDAFQRASLWTLVTIAVATGAIGVAWRHN